MCPHRRRHAVLVIATAAGLVLSAGASAGAGRQSAAPVAVVVPDSADATDVVGDGSEYAGTLDGSTLTMRLAAPRRLTVHVGGEVLKCAPEPYWSRIQVFGVTATGLADARIDCTTTASGSADGTAGTPWVIDYPPYKYANKGDPGLCVTVRSSSYNAPGTCPAKAYRGPSGYQRGAEVYIGPVRFTITASSPA